MQSHQLINSDSSCVEYFTPPFIIEAARKTMGGIDLDPASSEQANRIVKATKLFDVKVDGLAQMWGTKLNPSRLWHNPPYGRKEAACSPSCEKKHAHHSFPLHGTGAWIEKLMLECRAGRVSQACCITFASTSEKWFRPLMDYTNCFLSPRTNYLLPDGTVKIGVTKGSVVTYFGPHASEFRENFSKLGAVKV